MKKFHFHLESVLNYRLLKEDEAKQRLAQAQKLASRHMELLAAFQKELDEEQGRMVSEGKGTGLEVTAALHRDLYLGSLQQAIEKQQQEVNRARAEVMTCRRLVAKAHQDTKVMENLKAKRWQQYSNEMDKQEQKVMDELGLSGFVRKANEY
ncbi:flagellar export protein FliJ [Zhaonella formicivorans]|uniref:flagellar export protein FliJ n=1 Tax=Zhaonella formicivorans TaxID=2528593 RepID=UPI0010E23CBA|nr:flagellar export protein FliJ [Zhaonella formicivorans]